MIPNLTIYEDAFEMAMKIAWRSESGLRSVQLPHVVSHTIVAIVMHFERPRGGGDESPDPSARCESQWHVPCREAFAQFFGAT